MISLFSYSTTVWSLYLDAFLLFWREALYTGAKSAYLLRRYENICA